MLGFFDTDLIVYIMSFEIACNPNFYHFELFAMWESTQFRCKQLDKNKRFLPSVVSQPIQRDECLYIEYPVISTVSALFTSKNP